MDPHNSLPAECCQQSPSRVDNYTIHEETPQHEHETFCPQSEHETICAPAAVASGSVVVAPAPNLASISNVVAGDSTTKRKSKPFRKVMPK